MGKCPVDLNSDFSWALPPPFPPPVRGGDSVGRSEGREDLKSNFSSSPPSPQSVAAHSLPHTMTGEGGPADFPFSLSKFKSQSQKKGEGGAILDSSEGGCQMASSPLPLSESSLSDGQGGG